jgi:hypothetical protein
MEPRNESQPWPSSKVPLPAWTKTIAGSAYTVKRIDGDLFGIWRDVEELGTFELYGSSADELRVEHADQLSLEARTVLREFLATYREAPEGAAKRDR